LNAFLCTTYASSDRTHTGTTFSRVGPSADNSANRATNNGATHGPASNFLAGAYLIGIGLALFLVDVIATHIDTFSVDDGLVNKRLTACAPGQTKAQTKH
jgi:hypothetical protein